MGLCVLYPTYTLLFQLFALLDIIRMWMKVYRYIWYQEPMRAEGRRSVQLSIVVVVLCDGPLRVQKSAPNMAQVEEVYITPTLWCVVIYSVGLGIL